MFRVCNGHVKDCKQYCTELGVSQVLGNLGNYKYEDWDNKGLE